MSFSEQDRSTECINWHSAFVCDNFLTLGYFAWAGFKLVGGGLLRCDVEPAPVGGDFRFHHWNFIPKFVPSSQLSKCLLDLEIPPTEISELIDVITQANPHREISLLIVSDKSVEILWLKNLEIDPPACYLQIRDRWDEFMSSSLPPDLPESPDGSERSVDLSN
jgi:hypothetical protein